MVQGVTSPFSKDLLIEGVGFRATIKGAKIDLELGYSHPIEFALPDNIEASVDKQVMLTLKSPIKALLGQTTANIIKLRKPNSYSGKGVRLRQGLKRIVKLKLKEVKKK